MSSPLLIQLAIYFACFVLIWIASGLVVNPLSSLAKSWRLPSFIVSFFILGLLTSLPEITIGTISVINDDPIIYAGSLLGGVIVVLLGIVPLLGVIGNGVKIPTQLGKNQLVFTLLVVLAPAFLTADQQIGEWEAYFLILLYLCLFIFFSVKQDFLSKVRSALERKNKNWLSMIFKISIGVILLVLSSNQIVNSTIYFADLLEISPFFVSLIVVAIGTNLPEISIIFRSVMSNKKEVAFADYLGSASANSLLFGIFVLMGGRTVYLPNHFLQRFFFLATGIALFYVFARSRNFISRKESAVLLSLYIAFLVFEVLFISVLS